MSSLVKNTVMQNTLEDYHPLKNTWSLWYHLTTNNDWSLSGYTKIADFNYLEDAISIINAIDENIITTICLFVMKVGINPLWEDPRNKQGGAFSYRITNKYVFETFRDLLYVLIGETLTSSDSFNRNICGITLSPKKNFCVVKVWMQNKDFQNPALITDKVKNLIPSSALFKIHDDGKL